MGNKKRSAELCVIFNEMRADHPWATLKRLEVRDNIDHISRIILSKICSILENDKTQIKNFLN